MDENKPKPGLFYSAQNYLSLTLFAVMCVLLVLQLASRYLFSRPLLFTEEFSRFCYVWIAFLGLAIAHRRDDHIRIDLFANMLPSGVKRVLDKVVGILSIVMLAYLCYWGIEYLEFNSYSVAASIDFPLIYVYAALPVGCALGIVNIIWKMFRKS